MQNARAVNMPKDKVEAAIKRATGRDATNYHEVLYEGYAPHGIALIVETATDNPTRTVAHVRNVISKPWRQPRHQRQRELPVSERWGCFASIRPVSTRTSWNWT